MTRISPCVLPLLGAALAAQTTISPADYATVFGNQPVIGLLGQYPQNILQQIHGDLGTQARAIGQMSFRTSIANVQAVARTVELELLMGDSSFAARSRTFASNFLAQPQVVIARRQVALPDHTQAPRNGYPGPFDATLAFDVPFVYAGTDDLAWQATVFSDSTASGGRANFYPLDGFQYQEAATATSVEYGSGCVPIGRFAPMRASQLTRSSYVPTTQVTLQLGTSQAPRSTQLLVQLGVQSSNVPIPGLCGPLLVGGVVAEFPGATDPAGSFATSPLVFPFRPRLAGLRLYSQAFAFEARPGELPYCVSTGVQFDVPALPRQPASVASITAAGTSVSVSGTLLDLRGVIVEFR